MKIFLDTADLEAIRKANDTGLLDGVTTNPSKILQSGKKFTDVVVEICKIVSGPVSAEAVAVQASDIVEEAKKIENITLHYLQGKIQIELLLPLAILHNAQPDAEKAVEQRFNQALASVEEVSQISIHYH